MTPRDSRLNAVGHWLIEISALLVVFPWLDQVFREKPSDWYFFSEAITAALISLVIGLILVRDK